MFCQSSAISIYQGAYNVCLENALLKITDNQQDDIFQPVCLIRPAFSTGLLSFHYFPDTHFHRPHLLIESSLRQTLYHRHHLIKPTRQNVLLQLHYSQLKTNLNKSVNVPSLLTFIKFNRQRKWSEKQPRLLFIIISRGRQSCQRLLSLLSDSSERCDGLDFLRFLSFKPH